eukprot:6146112-Pleurochrysis_carterae.AAC.1
MNLLLLACADLRGNMEYQLLEEPNASGLGESGKASNKITYKCMFRQQICSAVVRWETWASVGECMMHMSNASDRCMALHV